MSAARITSAAKAGGSRGSLRRAEALLHPVGGDSFETAAETVFTWSEGKTSQLMNADRRGFGDKFKRQLGKKWAFGRSLFRAFFETLF